MTEEMKIHLALIQVNNLTQLLKDNQYESYLYNKLIGIQVELQRQLSCLTNTNYYTKIME